MTEAAKLLFSRKRRWRRRLVLLAGAAAMLFFTLRIMNQPPGGLGIADGELAACPDSPNCVSTFSLSAEHQMDPIPFRGATDQLVEKLKSIVEQLPRTRIVRQTDNYLHVECRSFWFGFVDAVEFLIDPEQKLIHFRSASRVGYSDLGVNRRRMETLQKACLEAL